MTRADVEQASGRLLKVSSIAIGNAKMPMAYPERRTQIPRRERLISIDQPPATEAEVPDPAPILI
jgi:hypothetical protein